MEFILHLWGDYIFQSNWAANNKTTNSFACLVHVILYSIGFYFLSPSWTAFAVIFGTHFLIDRFRLAKYLVYAKQFLAPPSATTDFQYHSFFDGGYKQFVKRRCVADGYKWKNCQATGYPAEIPTWMSVWLLIIADNTLHLTINYLALRFL